MLAYSPMTSSQRLEKNALYDYKSTDQLRLQEIRRGGAKLAAKSLLCIYHLYDVVGHRKWWRLDNFAIIE